MRKRVNIHICEYIVATNIWVVNTALSNPRRLIARLRTITAKPLCVGFGISSPEQAREACRLADGVIIGSKIVQLIEADASLAALRDFVKEVRESLDGLAKESP